MGPVVGGEGGGRELQSKQSGEVRTNTIGKDFFSSKLSKTPCNLIETRPRRRTDQHHQKRSERLKK